MASVPTWLVSVNFTLVVVAFVCIVASWIFVYNFRNKPIVAMGQPPMLSVLCFGALIVTTGMLFEVIFYSESKLSDAIGLNVCCSFITWFEYIGDITIFSILLIKLYRSFKVVQFRRGQKILPRHVFGPFLLIVLSGVGILIAWEVLYPLHYTDIQFPGETETVGSCGRVSDPGQIIFTAILQVFLFLLIIGIMVLAWKIRNINEEIGDSSRIFRLIRYLFLSSIVRAAVFYTIYYADVFGLGASARLSIIFTTDVIVQLFHAMASVGVLILPRMYYVCYERTHGNLPESVEMFGRGQVRVSVGSSNPISLRGGGGGDGDGDGDNYAWYERTQGNLPESAEMVEGGEVRVSVGSSNPTTLVNDGGGGAGDGDE